MNFRAEPADKPEKRDKLLGNSHRAMECIVINLPRAGERRQAVSRQFEAVGLEFEILEAIDWRDLGGEDWALVDRKSCDREGRHSLSDGMIACQPSHRKTREVIFFVV